MAAASNWPWPDSLDAMIAAPQYHRVVFESQHIRVVETRIPVGHTVPLHTHRWPGIYYTVAAGHFIRRDADGNVLFDSRTAPPETQKQFGENYLEALPPHTVENVCSSELHVLSVELKDAV